MNKSSMLSFARLLQPLPILNCILELSLNGFCWFTTSNLGVRHCVCGGTSFPSYLCRTMVRFSLAIFGVSYLGFNEWSWSMLTLNRQLNGDCAWEFGYLFTLFLWGKAQVMVKLVKLCRVLAWYVVSCNSKNISILDSVWFSHHWHFMAAKKLWMPP